MGVQSSEIEAMVSSEGEAMVESCGNTGRIGIYAGDDDDDDTDTGEPWCSWMDCAEGYDNRETGEAAVRVILHAQSFPLSTPCQTVVCVVCGVWSVVCFVFPYLFSLLLFSFFIVWETVYDVNIY